ncbi:hypothetical protein M5C97_08515 [Acidovorax sp. NCPPB 3859]|nr:MULTISPECIES: hypothetical protein [unclassified Acidovorax]MDA8452916.1 hypothetical protein [Acidovorax sp. GBBC 3297]MDA8462303.1 hypothetical protein [Acidovorax sp. GBBC 3333]MDA8467337.1 hypothetical protein [Acidovorax sp. GBBC 3332]MDA8472371.1 hypothetical protein [Acidovorax sp. GBBC 3299]WCM80312.1 hypothetical protein M5C94_08510 [Acidovorax sp. GBBC 712]
MPPYRPALPAGPARAIRHAILAAALACLAAPGGAQPVYRCGNAYGQQACDGGRVVDTAPQSITSGPAPGTATVYLCRARAGGRFWTPRHCHEHGAWVDRTETVPAGMRWEEQRAAAIAQRRQMTALAAPAPRRPLARVSRRKHPAERLGAACDRGTPALRESRAPSPNSHRTRERC